MAGGWKALIWNQDEARLRAAWRLLIHLALTLGLIALVTAPLGLQSESPLLVRWPGLRAVQALLRLLATVAGLWLASRFLDRRPMAGYGLRFHGAWWADFAFGLILGAVLVSAGVTVGLGLGWLGVSGTFEPGSADLSFAVAALISVAQYLCIGAYEELFSRGYQLRNLAEGFHTPRIGRQGALWLAVLASSGFFVLLHATSGESTWVSLLSVLLAGAILGVAVLLTGEVALSIGYHVSFNLFAGTVFGLSGQPGAPAFVALAPSDSLVAAGLGSPGGGLPGASVSALALLLIVVWVRGRHGEVRLHTEWATPDLRPPRHSEHDRLVRAVWSWFHLPFEGMGYRAERRQWGTYWSTGQVYISHLPIDRVGDLVQDVRACYGRGTIYLNVEDRTVDARLGPALEAAGCVAGRAEGFLAHVGPIPQRPPVSGVVAEPVNLANLHAFVMTKLEVFSGAADQAEAEDAPAPFDQGPSSPNTNRSPIDWRR
jgi:membrane protease YdiL (CAAX protease family)